MDPGQNTRRWKIEDRRWMPQITHHVSRFTSHVTRITFHAYEDFLLLMRTNVRRLSSVWKGRSAKSKAAAGAWMLSVAVTAGTFARSGCAPAQVGVGTNVLNERGIVPGALGNSRGRTHANGLTPRRKRLEAAARLLVAGSKTYTHQPGLALWLLLQ